MVSSSNFLLALNRQEVSSIPIWLMRQAGRYLPEYNAVRQQAGSFLKLCQTPELACEVTLQPIRRFGFDAAILFSDILTIPDAMGLGLRFEEGSGPIFAQSIRDERAVKALTVPDPYEKLAYVVKAVQHIRRALPAAVPLIGFAGSPFTLACYMIEGRGSRDFAIAKHMLYRRPDLFKTVLQVLSEAVSRYLIAQARAGADCIMLFDTWGGLLTTEDYLDYSLKPMAQIRTALRAACPNTPLICFTKGGGQWLESMADHADALGLDWSTSMEQALIRVGDRVALQGNLDPLALCAPPHAFLPRVAAILQKVKDLQIKRQALGKPPLGYIFNLGHGIVPQVPPDHVTALVEYVHDFC